METFIKEVSVAAGRFLGPSVRGIPSRMCSLNRFLSCLS